MKTCAGIILSLLTVSVTALYSSSDDVVELTPANFNSRVINSDELWMVEFYAPWCGHCKSLAPEWKKAASALKGVVNVGAVDANEHQSLGGQYGVKGFPTIKIFGANKNKPTDFNGGRQAQAIVDSAMSELRSLVNGRMSGKGGSSGGGRKSGGGGGGGGSGGQGGDTKDVIELTDGNFESEVLDSEEMVLVEFFAPWCGHCKSLAPHWAQAATELKGKVKVGALDATVHTVMASRYGVRGYPTIKMFPAGKKDGQVEEFDGGRTADDIVAWALDKLAANIPPPEVIQLTEQAVLQKACEDHQLCVIAFLPHILDCQADCRNSYLETLTMLADKYKKRMWGWVWAEAGAQPDVEEALGVGGFGYPAMAAANTRKMKYSWLRGSFSESGIGEFLRELAVGRGSTAPIKNAELPKVLASDPWDGKDGEMPEEEEIDLSDVELDDLEDLDKKTEL